MVTNLDDAVISVRIDTSDAQKELVALDDQAGEVGAKAKDARGALGRGARGTRRVGARQGKPAADAAARGSGGVVAEGAAIATAARFGLKTAARGLGIVGVALAVKDVVEIGGALAAAEIRGATTLTPTGPGGIAAFIAEKAVRETLASTVELLTNQMAVVQAAISTLAGTAGDIKTAAIGQVLFGGTTEDLLQFGGERFGARAAMARFEFEKNIAQKALAGTAAARVIGDVVGSQIAGGFTRFMGN